MWNKYVVGIKVIVERYADPRNEVKKGPLVTICMEATLLSLIWKWNRGTGEGGDSTPPVSKGAFNPSRTVKTLKRAKFRQMKLNQFNYKRFEKATATMVDYYICNLICYGRPLAHTASPNGGLPILTMLSKAASSTLYNLYAWFAVPPAGVREPGPLGSPVQLSLRRRWSQFSQCGLVPGPWFLVSLSLSQMWLRG